MSLSQTERWLAAVACIVICGVFAFSAWITGYVSAAVITVILGLGISGCCVFASESLLKKIGLFW
jgi:hypothetical protein